MFKFELFVKKNDKTIIQNFYFVHRVLKIKKQHLKTHFRTKNIVTRHLYIHSKKKKILKNYSFDYTYVLWYMQRQGSLAIVSPCVSSSKHMTHSPLSSFKTSSTK